jgi:histidyl-tRNA synthetase
MKFQPPKGTRDLMPEDAERLNYVKSVVSQVFESFGFFPMYTPAFESFDLLAAKGGLGEAVKDEIYYFKDKSQRELGLRFDQTMPLARVIASNPQMPKPFKRYVIGTVWRYDNPQAMRWREFWQADIDIVGSSSLSADAEVVAAACECLEKLGFKNYYVRVNNRKFLDATIGPVTGSRKADVYRILDKLDKIGEDGVKAELKKIGCDKKEVLALISNKSCAAGDGEIREFLELMKAFGFGDRIEPDASLVRGLEYYTGLVFEISLGRRVSCGGGGRYDDLIKKVGGQKTEAVGISLGIDRIAEVMKEEKMPVAKLRPRVFVANIGESVRSDVVKVATQLRGLGLDVIMNVTDRFISKQMELAKSLGIRYVVIVGEDEVKSGKYKLRDMESKEQTEKTVYQISESVA